MQYALSKGVDVIAAAGNENQNLDDPKVDSSSPNNVSYSDIIQNRPVDLVSTAMTPSTAGSHWGDPCAVLRACLQSRHYQLPDTKPYLT